MIHENYPMYRDTVVQTNDQPIPTPPASAITFDDVFGTSPSPSFTTSSPHPPAPSTELSEIPRLRATHLTAGYRDGVAASKAHNVQAGFDEGYALGAVLGLRAGWILGVAHGLVRALERRRIQRRGRRGLQEEGSEREGELGGKERERMEQRRGQMLSEAQEVLARAQTELAVQSLFGLEYFGEEGTWMYEVPDEEGEITFDEVVNAHPLVQRWTKTIRDLAVSWDVDLDAAVKAAEFDDAGLT
ncbi:MAG: Essential protein Yae1, N terminal [Bathelium mastoideum]|nr:MAG: Essential protein Yae1, N terminal [Bathelium mastoideum]